MPASPTGGQGLTQEALIEVLRNQHQNIVQQQNLIAGQGAQISELTKLGLVQMQTDVLKDQAQREADERERKAEEERKAAEEAATSSTPRAGSLFTSAPAENRQSCGVQGVGLRFSVEVLVALWVTTCFRYLRELCISIQYL